MHAFNMNVHIYKIPIFTIIIKTLMLDSTPMSNIFKKYIITLSFIRAPNAHYITIYMKSSWQYLVTAVECL